jgi:hypothetical protein
MKVQYKVIPCDKDNGPLAVYEQAGPVKFCCAEMCQEWNILVGFGIKGHPRTTSREVNVFTQHPQASGSILVGITEIRYCPWCGERIELCRVK